MGRPDAVLLGVSDASRRLRHCRKGAMASRWFIEIPDGGRAILFYLYRTSSITF